MTDTCMLKNKYPAIIIVLFALQFLLINPLGEFALNDDWVHTDTIRHWTQTGEFRMLPFAGPTFYVPILYGAGLVKLFGFSFSLLRISTLVITLALLLIYYALLNKITKNPLWSFVGVLVLWFNPIFYNLTFTFMTDVPALFLLVYSLFLYYKGFDERKPIYLFVASLLSITGFYTRQTNIILFVAAGLYALTKLKDIKFKHLAWSFGIPLAIGIAIYIFLMKNNLLPQGTALHIIKNPLELGKHALWWLWYSIVYMGFFVFPLCVGWIIKKIKSPSPNRGGLGGVIAFAIISMFLALIIRQTLHVQFPYILNIINVHGLGPMRNVLNGALIPLFSSKVWGIITLLSAGSGGWFVYMLSSKKSPISFNIFNIFLILYLIPLLLFESFDRYYLPLFVVATIFILKKITEENNSLIRNPLISIVICIFAIFSISQTQFYLNWNKARWDMATRVLNETKLEPHQIDGGYEWDGWHAYWSAHASGLKNGAWTAQWWIRNLFVNNTEDYIVSFSPIPPYDVVETRKVNGWNPNNTLYLLKKP